MVQAGKRRALARKLRESARQSGPARPRSRRSL